MHMQCEPTPKALPFPLDARRSRGWGGGICISPYVAHSWVQTGTSANMQKMQYLYSSGLSEKPGGAELLLECHTKTDGWGMRWGGAVRLAGHSQVGKQQPLGWEERPSFCQSTVFRGNDILQEET